MRDWPTPRRLLRRTRERGISWLFQRIVSEWRSPQYRQSMRILQTVRRLSISGAVGFTFERTSSTPKRLVACYTLTDPTTSYDFAYFLAAAEITAKANGLETFEVALVHRDFTLAPSADLQDDVQGTTNFEWRLNNIVKPLADYYPSCINVTKVCSAVAFLNATSGGSVYPSAYSWNFNPPMDYRTVFDLLDQRRHTGFRAPEKGLEILERWLKANGVEQEFATITLRQRRWDPSRNCNFPAWIQFAHWAREHELDIVFIPDTDSAVELDPALFDFPVFHPACWNMGLRLAAYERAYVNFGVSNGPMSLPVLTPSCSYIRFNPDRGGAAHSFLRDHYGLTPGDPQWPGAGPHQITVWGDDEFASIVQALHRWQIERELT